MTPSQFAESVGQLLATSNYKFARMEVLDRVFFLGRFGDDGAPVEVNTDLKEGSPFFSVAGSLAGNVPLSVDLGVWLSEIMVTFPTVWTSAVSDSMTRTASVRLGRTLYGPLVTRDGMILAIDTVANLVAGLGGPLVERFGGERAGVLFDARIKLMSDGVE